MVAGKDHSSGNTGKEVKASGENRKKILNPHLTASLHTYHSAVSWLQKENLAAKAQCETQYQLYHLAATHTQLSRRERMLFPLQLLPTAWPWPLLGMMHWRSFFLMSFQPSWRQETSQSWTVP